MVKSVTCYTDQIPKANAYRCSISKKGLKKFVRRLSTMRTSTFSPVFICERGRWRNWILMLSKKSTLVSVWKFHRSTQLRRCNRRAEMRDVLPKRKRATNKITNISLPSASGALPSNIHQPLPRMMFLFFSLSEVMLILTPLEIPTDELKKIEAPCEIPVDEIMISSETLKKITMDEFALSP